MRGVILFALLTVGSVGCTHRQLTRSAINTTTTVMEIEYRTVLTNLAMFSCHPETLPNHVRLRDGVVQIDDSVGVGLSGGLTTFGGSDLGIERYGPSGSRHVTEQWGTDAVCDPRTVKALQDIYRVAHGLPPLPDPAAVAFAEHRGEPAGDDGLQGPSVSEGITQTRHRLEEDKAESPAKSQGGQSKAGKSDAPIPVAVLLADVPAPGWFSIGGKKDVPKDACYVGRFGDRYAWVTAVGVPSLARLTLAVLSATKFKPGEAGGQRGLAVTR